MFLRPDNAYRFLWSLESEDMTEKVKLINGVVMLHCMCDCACMCNCACMNICKGWVIVYFKTYAFFRTIILVLQSLCLLIDKLNTNIVEQVYHAVLGLSGTRTKPGVYVCDTIMDTDWYYIKYYYFWTKYFYSKIYLYTIYFSLWYRIHWNKLWRICPFPYFGLDCQSTCNCSEENWDYFKGCRHSTSGLFLYDWIYY